MSASVLVVGGAGYIGSHVTKALIRGGYETIVFDNLSSGLRENLFPESTFIHGDVLIPHQIEAAMEGVEAVIHLAALKAAGDSMVLPERYALHNINGTVNLLNAMAAKEVKAIVFSSSAAVYGTPQYLPLDEAHPVNPTNFYGYTKLAIEQLLEWYMQLKGIQYASLRYFNAAGYDVDREIGGLEQNPNNLLPIILEAIVGLRESVEVYGDDYDTDDGSGVRDYIHVTDLAHAHVKALRYLEHHQRSITANLGTSKGLSVFEVIKHAKELSRIDFPVKVVDRRPGDTDTVIASAQKAKEMLGWLPRYSTPEKLIGTMIDAYRTHYING